MTVLYPDVPIRHTIGDCYLEIGEKLWHILALCALPYLLSVGIYVGTDYIIALNIHWVPKGVLEVGSVVIITLIIQSYFSLALYRLLLLDEYRILPDISAAGRARYVKFMMYFLSFLLAAVLALAVAGLVWLLLWRWAVWAQPLVFPLYLSAMTLAFMRLAFVFPAVSVDAPYTLRDSWSTTAGLNIKLITIAAATIAPPFLILLGLRLGLENTFGFYIETSDEFGIRILTTAYYSFAFLGTLLSFVLAIALVTVTAIVFYIRTGWRPGATRVA